MKSYAVARLDEIDEINDGREPFRPIRHHFGITSFGVNAWTAPNAGDRIINEHDESEPDSPEELYLVVRGAGRVRTRRRSGGCARRDVRVRVSGREADGVCRGARHDGGRARRHPGKAYEPDGWELWAPLNPLYE